MQARTGFSARATEDYQTLAGLVMSLLDRLPMVGDCLAWNGWTLTVEAVEERRVRQVRLTPNGDAGAAGA
ncbi:Transporter associated domain protein [compost metagenome]